MIMEMDPILTMTKKRAQQPAHKVANGSKKNGRNQPSKMVPKSEGVSRPLDSFQKPSSVAAAYASGRTTKMPKIVRTSDRVRIVHSELVASVSGSVAFTQASGFALNPGLAASFPWLSSQAQGWERYRFHKLRYCYYTRTGSNIPGSVMIVPDYDAADSAPVSEQIASAYRDVAEDAPWKNVCCELQSQSMNAIGPSRFIRLGALAANQDVKTYDSGNLFVFTMDGTAVPWGKLWVEYDVELITPQLNASGASIMATQGIQSSNPDSATMLGTQVPVSGSSSLVTVAGEVVTFLQAGTFLVNYFGHGTTVTVTAAPVAAAGGVIIDQDAAGSGTAALAQAIQLTAVVGTTLTFNETYVAGTSSLLIVTQVPSGIGSLL